MNYKLTYLTAASVVALLTTDAMGAAKKKASAPKKPVVHKVNPQHCSEAKSLREQVCELMKKIDQLEKGPPVKEQEIVRHTPKNNVRLKVSGHLNRAAWWADNGKSSGIQYVDNNNSSSRLIVDASGDFSSDLTVGGIFEVELLQNSTATTDVKNMGGSNTNAAFTARKSEVYFASKSLGTLLLGKGYTASFLSMVATDLSKTEVALEGAKVADMAAGVTFFNKTRNRLDQGRAGNSAAWKVGQVFDQCDGLQRRDRIRYDTPKFAGFNLAASHMFNNKNDEWDVALKYDGKFEGTELRAQIAYLEDQSIVITNGPRTNTSDAQGYQQVNGSIGVLFPVGISLMVAGAHRDWKSIQFNNGTKQSPPKGKLMFGKIGFQHKFCEAGTTAFAVDYGQYQNFILDTTNVVTIHQKHKGTVWGVGVVQFLDRVATELYLVGRQYKLKVPGNDKFKPVNVIMSGARVKF